MMHEVKSFGEISKKTGPAVSPYQQLRRLPVEHIKQGHKLLSVLYEHIEGVNFARNCGSTVAQAKPSKTLASVHVRESRA